MKIGILGGGQLAQLLCLAGIPLGFEFHCLVDQKNVPAAPVSTLHIGNIHDLATLNAFCETVDVVTYENENIEIDTLHHIQQHRALHPNKESIRISQDRLLEKNCFRDLNIETVPYYAIDSYETLVSAFDACNGDALLKTRRFGYDGKGQYRLQSKRDLIPAWEALGKQPLILEAWIDFEMEVSLIGVRAKNQDVRYYPLIKNTHHEGILRQSIAPFENNILYEKAKTAMDQLFTHLDYVGVLTVEFFVKDHQLFANEMAPRVHNSGHWTIEGAQTSQFENHLRAICDLPLGETTPRGCSLLVNCIGEHPALSTVLKIPGAHYHHYGKSPRPGRKLGHVTVVGEKLEELEHIIKSYFSINS